MTDATWLDATAQAELVRSGEATPLELVDAAIERVERINPQLNAVIHPLFESAREQAQGTLADGPFRGVPVLFKDLGCAVEGDPYHEGMAIAKRLGFRATHTDDLARRYLDAGFVCIGRTNTPEQGLVPTTEPYAYGPTRNPWNTEHTTGGSSGGSAAAVASGMVPLAHANDGGGSIRIPASACGLVGLKPSRGRVTGAPFGDPLSSMLTVDLCVSRTVRDTAALLDAVHGPAVGDTVVAPAPTRPYLDEVGADPGTLRIGILLHDPLTGDMAKPECIAATEAAGNLLESLGHRVEQSSPKALDDPSIVGHFTSLWAGGLAAALAGWEQALGEKITEADVEPLTWGLAEMGRTISAVDYATAIALLTAKTRAVAQWWADGFDLLLTPTLAEPPVPLGTFDSPDNPILGFMRAAQFTPFTPAFNITGQPAISLPTAMSSDGLPIGVHLVGAFAREDLLLRVAAQVESAAPWADRRPPVHA
jgi:amidase